MSMRQTVGRLYRAPLRAAAAATGVPLPVRFNGRWAWWSAAVWPGFRVQNEPHMEAALRRGLSPGMGFADIGAHHGIWSALASRLVGDRGTVVACEPSPAFETLRRHLGRRGNVRLLRTAVGGEAGSVDFFAHGELTTGSVRQDITEINRHLDPAGSISRITVPIDTLDHLLAAEVVDGGRRWLVKVDVEGHEAEVLRGAERLLASSVVDWIVEVHPPQLRLSGRNEADVLGPFERHGYAVRVFDRATTGLYTLAASRDAGRLP